MININYLVKRCLCIFYLFETLLYSSCSLPEKNKKETGFSGWETVAGTKSGNRYSSLNQINISNVGQLKVAWTYSSHDKDKDDHSQIQCNPIVVGGILYATSPALKLFALDAATGKQHWIFDPFKDKGKSVAVSLSVNRGVTYWQDIDGSKKRILYGVGAFIFCINAETGMPEQSFGKNGKISLNEGLDRDAKDLFISSNSPGIIYKDLLILGSRLAETADAAPGHIRAYDVLTGKRRWIFHTIPFPGERGYDSWKDSKAWENNGGVNCWAGMSLDEKLGIVYVPTGSASYDFWGGNRKGDNLYANCILALDAATGKYIWHYQTVHHDVWDKDLPASPNLVTLIQNGRKIDALAQVTKTGYVFLLDRRTGKPIFPINEYPVSTKGLPGEELSPTQPIPVLPQQFTRNRYTDSLVPDMFPESKESITRKIRGLAYGELFIPPSKQGTVLFPGFDGGAEWGGASFDPEDQVLYVNANEIPWIFRMIDVPKANSGQLHAPGHTIYNQNCVGCHGPDLKGDGKGNYPSLVAIQNRLNESQVRAILASGKNRMPSFKQISEEDKKELLAFLFNTKENKEYTPTSKSSKASKMLAEIPYISPGYDRMSDTLGYPGIKPPWGTLNAISMNTGRLLWKTTLGIYPELVKKGIPPTGTENYGGPVSTAGGLIFIAASRDEKMRAFNKKTGQELWSFDLPAAGYATPCVYEKDGKEYVVIAAGGGKSHTKSGDSYVAFSLP